MGGGELRIGDREIGRPREGAVHVHSEAVHVHVHEGASGTRPRGTGCFREDDTVYGYGNENGNDGHSGQECVECIRLL